MIYLNRSIIILLTITTILSLGYHSQAQIEYGEMIDEEVIDESESVIPEKERKTKLKLLQREISLKIRDAWAADNYDSLAIHLSQEIKDESHLLKPLMKQIHNAYSDITLSSFYKNQIFATSYWNKSEGHRLNIRHFYRPTSDSYEVFMIVLSIWTQGEEETRYDLPAINGDIYQITQDLDHNRFDTTEEQYALSLSGLDKSKEAIRDSTIARFGILTIIINHFESIVKLDKPTTLITEFEFLDLERAYRDIKEQYTLIAYAENNEFEKIRSYYNDLSDYQKKYFKMNRIKDFYRSPESYNEYAENYKKISEIFNRN